MVDTNKIVATKKVVQGTPPISYVELSPRGTRKKKRIRYVADPRIEPYKAGGRQYYRYRRGVDKPEHLGTADYIKKAVAFYRQEQGKIASGENHGRKRA